VICRLLANPLTPGVEMSLTVLMSVYQKESPAHLRLCLESLALQTLCASEVVIVEDGPLGSQLDSAIAAYGELLPIVLARLPVHVGLGTALREGLSMCRGEYVARMDSDDICTLKRFQKQVAFLDSNPEVDVVGSAIEEFGGGSGPVRTIRRLPASGKELLRFAHFRNPLNHMTTMFRRNSVLAAGSYQPFPGFEDYHLWARMLKNGNCLHNMPEIFVHVRSDSGMQSRRGGFAYFKQDVAFQLFLQKIGLITAPECIRNIVMRAPFRLAPSSVRSICYQLFLRDGGTPSGAFHHG
jgi:glycosyltransferase involved in cell wall biosynthesis